MLCPIYVKQLPHKPQVTVQFLPNHLVIIDGDRIISTDAKPSKFCRLNGMLYAWCLYNGLYYLEGERMKRVASRYSNYFIEPGMISGVNGLPGSEDFTIQELSVTLYIPNPQSFQVILSVGGGLLYTENNERQLLYYDLLEQEKRTLFKIPQLNRELRAIILSFICTF
jgi:hypothetical protein